MDLSNRYRDSFVLKKKNIGEKGPLKCCECGRTNVTLRKTSAGFYICNKCIDVTENFLNKEKKDVREI